MKGIFLGACLIGALGAGGAPLTLSNRYFAVKLDGKTGGVASLVLAADKVVKRDPSV